MSASGSRLTIKREPEENACSRLPVVLASGTDNNNSGDGGKRAKSVPSCFLRIVKEEPPDEDEAVPTSKPGAAGTATPSPVGVPTVPGPGPATLVVSADGGIVIKTEVLDEQEEEEERDEEEDSIGVDVDDDDDDIEFSECDFDDDDEAEDDKDDEDFELDSSEAADTPDGSSNKSSSASSFLVEGCPETEESDLNRRKRIKRTDSDADVVEASSNERGSFDFNGMKIETVGNYSKCPRCEKSIKSTFIIRHIKLHDAPAEKYDCPEKGCSLQVSE